MKAAKNRGWDGEPLRGWTGYAIAVGATVLTLALRLSMDSMLGGYPTVVMFAMPIMLSAYLGGLGPGLLATALSSLLASYYLLPPIHSFAVISMIDRWQQIFVALTGVVISWLTETLHGARRRATRATSEEQRTQAAMAWSEELLAKSFRLSPDCVVIVRLSDGTVLEANEALCTLWGAPREKILGHPAREHLHWLGEEERLAFQQILLERGEYLNYETTFDLSSGRRAGFSLSCRVITFAGESCVLSVMRDVTEQKRGEAAAARLAAIVASSDDAIISKDFDSIITSWNGGAEKIFGYSSEEITGTSILRLIPPERQDEENFILGQIRQGKNVRNFETVRLTKAGRLLPVSVTVSPIRGVGGQLVGASKIVRDISVQKAHEHEIARLTRLYSALSQVNQAIVMTRDRDALFAKICQVLVEYGGFQMAWIGLVDTATRRVNPVKQWGDSRNYLSETVVYADDRPEGQGPIGTAIREDRTEICNDVAQDPRTGPWREAAARAGYRASAALPIRQGGVVCGSINVYADETGFFQNREVALLKEAAGDVSFGLDNLAREDVRQAAEEALRSSEVRYRTLFETMIEGFCTIEMIFDAAGKAVDSRFIEVNPAFEKQTGLRDVEGKLMRDLAPTHEEYWFEICGKVARTGEPVHFENEARALGRHYDVCAYRVGGPDSRKIACVFNDITARKRTEQAIQASEHYFHFLHDLVEATRTLGDPAEIMRVTARMLGEYLHASRCAYADVESDSEEFTILHDYTDGCASTVGHYQLSHFGPRAVATLHRGQTLIIRNVGTELLPGDGAEMFKAIGIEAIITCPLVKEGGLRAMMAVHQSAPRDWQPREISVVEDVVERCWASIERRRSDQKIREQLDELLRWQEVMLNREDRVEALKTEVNEQLTRQGQPPRYAAPQRP